MRFRTFLASVACAALALTGSVTLGGTAEAAVPTPTRVVNCGTAGHGTVSGSTCTLPRGGTCSVATGATSCSVTLRNRFGGLGGRFGGGFNGRFGGGFNGRLGGFGGGGLMNGNLLPLSGGFDLNVCQYPTWSQLSAYQAARLAAIEAQLGQGDFSTLYAQLVAQANCGDSASTAVIPDGLGLNGQFLNAGSFGVVGLPAVNVCTYRDFGRFNGRFGGLHTRFGSLGGAFGAHASNVWLRLRMQAGC